MKITMDVKGLEGVLDTLQALPPEIVSKRGGPVKNALRKAANVIKDQAAINLQKAIDHNGSESTGLLMKNLIVTRGKEPLGTKGERYLIRVRRKAYDGEKLGRRQRAGKRVTTHKTASLLEYGSSHQPATPWLRPAVKQKGGQAIKVFTDDLNKRIDAVVRKLERQNQGRR